MGWTYLVNDENTAEMVWIFGWETKHRSDKCRKRRKIMIECYHMIKEKLPIDAKAVKSKI